VQDDRLVFDETDQEFLNQQAVVDYDQGGGRGHSELLVGQIWIVDRVESTLVAIP
jgi:hypothetical protein